MLGLLDLNDDCLRLIAARAATSGGWAPGLLGASTRTRRAALDAVTHLTIAWRPPRLYRPGRKRPFSETRGSMESNGGEIGGPSGPSHSGGPYVGCTTNLDRNASVVGKWAESVIFTLSRTTGLRSVAVSSVSPPSLALANAWAYIGIALRETRVTVITAQGDVTPAITTIGSRCAGRPPLRVLRLTFLDGPLLGLPAALAAVAPGLEVLEVRAIGVLSAATDTVFLPNAVVLPALKTLELHCTTTLDILDEPTALGLAATCPALNRLALFGCRMALGIGVLLAAAVGALPRLTNLELQTAFVPDVPGQPSCATDLANFFRGRRLDALTLSVEDEGWSTHASREFVPRLVDAMLSLAALPLAIELADSDLLGNAAIARFLSEGREAASVRQLGLPLTRVGSDLVGRLPPLPQLTSLTLRLSSSADRATVPPSWAVPPALATLRIDVFESSTASSTAPLPAPPALIGWMLREVAASAAVATLTSVRIGGIEALDVPFLDAVAGLAAATALRSLEIGTLSHRTAVASAEAIRRLHASLPQVATEVWCFGRGGVRVGARR